MNTLRKSDPTSDDMSLREGEMKLKRRNRRLVLLFTALTLSGVAFGFAMAWIEPEGSAPLESRLSIPVAMAFALPWVGIMFAGTRLYVRRADEVSRNNNLTAVATAGAIILLGYPVWMLMARADLLPEATALGVYLALYLALVVAYGWRVIRQRFG